MKFIYRNCQQEGQTKGKRLVTDFFRRDHDRLELLFQEFCEAQTAGAPTAPGAFHQLRVAMDRHLNWEETLMFPLYEGRADQAGQQPITAMRADHEELQELLATLHRQLVDHDPAIAPVLTRLGELMELHHSREEVIVYGLIDDELNDADRDRLFARLDEGA